MGPGYSLNPGRYVGVAEKKEDDFVFSENLYALNEELERQINSLLYERLALSKDREKVLEFYNYVLKCFVLIDLKVGKLTHQDIGQIDFYVHYFEKEERLVGDNPSIGLILCSDKNETMVRYTLLEDSKQIFASEYKLYLPTEEELKTELEREREMLEIGRVWGG